MENLEQLLLNTRSRYQARSEEREERLDNLQKLGRGGDWRKVDEPERIFNRLRRVDAQTVISDAMADTTTYRGGAPRVNVLESIIGESELKSVDFLLRGAQVVRTIGRIIIRGANDKRMGYGTGFMISPRLLMTNNHVLADVTRARHSVVQFGYYETYEGQLQAPVEYAFEPEVFFTTNEPLDYTIVAVSQTDTSGEIQREEAWNPLIRQSGKAIVGERVNIIQHPGGKPMQLVLRDNEIVDVFDDFLHYKADTEPGSSGAPVLNDNWEVAALHHSGVPETTTEGKILLSTGEPWDGARDSMHQIAWRANEGVRISRIVATMDEVDLSPKQKRLYDAVFEPMPKLDINEAIPSIVPPVNPSVEVVTPVDLESTQTQNPVVEPDGSLSWYVRLNVNPMVSGGSTVPSITVTPPTVTADGGDGDKPRADDARKHLDDHTVDTLYYDPEADRVEREAYYGANFGEGLNGAELFSALHDLMTETHTTVYSYRAARWDHLYPVIDRHESGKLRNIYSGTLLDPVEAIRQEMVLIDQRRDEMLEILAQESFSSEEDRLARLEMLEASYPFNCEHVVPQSWFEKRKPMVSDLHHLFAAEPDCNSFRSNVPYYQFSPFEEAVRDDCGRRETGKFEPEWGHGIVARATLYFLLRYPGEVGDENRELQRERLSVLKDWHKTYKVDRYELHRNTTIYKAQGNRNPLIDFPELIDRIDFELGFGG